MPVSNFAPSRFPALPGVTFPTPLPTEHSFVARLSRPRRDVQPLPEPRLTAEAVSLLSELASEMAADDPNVSGGGSSAAKRLSKYGAERLQVSEGKDWKEQLWLEGAIQYARQASEARQTAMVQKRRSRLTRWLSHWHGTPGMQTF